MMNHRREGWETECEGRYYIPTNSLQDLRVLKLKKSLAFGENFEVKSGNIHLEGIYSSMHSLCK